MNELQRVRHTQDALITVINESALPLTTVHFMLMDIQRQIQAALEKEPENKEEETDELHENNMGE